MTPKQLHGSPRTLDDQRLRCGTVTLLLMLRVLVDADNVAPRRLQPVLDALADVTDPVELTASGRPEALARLAGRRPRELIATAGWQRADLALAQAYTPTDDPLVLVSGDGDFGLLASRHPGPCWSSAARPVAGCATATTVVDPATEGMQPILDWLRTNGVV